MGHPSGEVQLGPETDTALSRWPAVISSESVLDAVAAILLQRPRAWLDRESPDRGQRVSARSLAST